MATTNEQHRVSRRGFLRKLGGGRIGLSGAREATAQLQELGVIVAPLRQGSGWLHVHCRDAASFGDEEMALLRPLRERIAWLDVAGTEVTAEGLSVAGEMPHLQRLYLQNTAVGDEALEHVKGLGQLEYLNLYGTGVTDAGLAHLRGLGKLSRLFLWQTNVSEAGVRQLRRHLPGLDVNTGETF